MVLPDEARQTVVSYLAHQGKKDVSAVVEVIERERRRLLDLLGDISQEQAEFVPSPGQWSIRDVVRHVAGSERGVARIIAELAGAVEPAEAPAVAGQSLTELCRELKEARVQLLQVVQRLGQDANLDAKHEHPFFGSLNWKEWLAFQRVHDGDHIQQIEAVQRSSSYPKA